MKRGRFITIGSFDGIHLGHQALIERTVLEAKKRGYKTLALSFRTPPRMVLNPTSKLALLSTEKEKEQLFKKFGIDDVHFLDFDHDISQMKGFYFFKKVLLERFQAKGIVVGLDFRFGMNRSSGAHELVRWGGEFEIPIWVIPPVKWSKSIVSSTLVRNLFEENKFIKASHFLGHPYLISGQVKKGEKIGSKIGFPTANIEVSKGKILPLGVYVVKGKVERSSRSQISSWGICNIGYKPTVSKSKFPHVEVHFLKKLPPLYNREISIELLHRLRGEKKFNNLSALQKAIQSDQKRATLWIKKHQ
ncbi:MAG: bifunctional riboflavin kinase/FAD synthetase [Elusimicrobiota bacterium]